MSRSVALKRTTPLARTTGLSRTTGLVRNTPLQAPRSPLRRSRLSPVSSERRAEDVAWRRLKATVWERDGGRCRVTDVWPEVVCGGRVDVHHIEPTGRGFPRLCPVDRLVLSCRAHHEALHTESRIAKERGLLR